MKALLIVFVFTPLCIMTAVMVTTMLADSRRDRRTQYHIKRLTTQPSWANRTKAEIAQEAGRIAGQETFCLMEGGFDGGGSDGGGGE